MKTGRPEDTMARTHTTLGELITVLYDEFLAVYDDEELASVAVAATINEILADHASVTAEAPIADAA
jgi:hypothetical protein